MLVQALATGYSVAVRLSVSRPLSRDECRGGERPCPWVSCRMHLQIDVNPETGTIRMNFDDLDEMVETCALDVAEQGRHTLDAVGELLGLTRERIRQVESLALKKVRTFRRDELGQDPPPIPRRPALTLVELAERDLSDC